LRAEIESSVQRSPRRNASSTPIAVARLSPGAGVSSPRRSRMERRDPWRIEIDQRGRTIQRALSEQRAAPLVPATGHLRRKRAGGEPERRFRVSATVRRSGLASPALTGRRSVARTRFDDENPGSPSPRRSESRDSQRRQVKRSLIGRRTIKRTVPSEDPRTATGFAAAHRSSSDLGVAARASNVKIHRSCTSALFVDEKKTFEQHRSPPPGSARSPLSRINRFAATLDEKSSRNDFGKKIGVVRSHRSGGTQRDPATRAARSRWDPSEGTSA